MISVSGRKEAGLSMEEHLKIFKTPLRDIDSVFGFTYHKPSPLYGGRLATGYSITPEDIKYLYDNGIGVKLPLSNIYWSEEMYIDSRPLLGDLHRSGNAIVVSTPQLAERIREDYPLYSVELSAVKDIDTATKLNQVDRTLYDTIVLPMCANDDLVFLNSINNKEQIRLFLNVECSYNCPKKVCYTSISKANKELVGDDFNMKCSAWTYNLPRKFKVDPSVDWSAYRFTGLEDLGFSRFKLINPIPYQQRIELMLEE